MHATIIGGGRIGRGFVASLLKRNQVEITFFDTDQELVGNFEQYSSYTVHVLGNEKENTIINKYKINHINDSQAWADELTRTDIIFTAVGGKNLTSLGKIIGKNYQQALTREEVLSFILVTCENWMTPADDLQQAVESQLTNEEKKFFKIMLMLRKQLFEPQVLQHLQGKKLLIHWTLGFKIIGYCQLMEKEFKIIQSRIYVILNLTTTLEKCLLKKFIPTIQVLL